MFCMNLVRFWFVPVCCTQVYWSENEDLCLLACQDNYYVLRYHATVVEVRRNSIEMETLLAEEWGRVCNNAEFRIEIRFGS